MGKDTSTPDRTRYVVAFHEVDRHYGGPGEGGWWYDTGTLKRIISIHHSEEAAFQMVRRANGLLTQIERGRRDVTSMAYGGGRHRAEVLDDTAPRFFPED